MRKFASIVALTLLLVLWLSIAVNAYRVVYRQLDQWSPPYLWYVLAEAPDAGRSRAVEVALQRAVQSADAIVSSFPDP